MFVVHYLDVEYDLSQVFFIATANVIHTVPAALQDRMEVIRLSGYTELEKMEIAKRFLVRKQMEGTGLQAEQIDFKDEGISSLIQYYTREAGVRNLEREIGNVCRKVTRQVVNASSGKEKKTLAKAVINDAKVQELLGPWKFRDLKAEKCNEIGAATGLAWTEVGGQHPLARPVPGYCSRFLPQPGCAYSHSRGRHPQGRAFGGNHSGHHHLQRAHQDSGAL
jgi:ATP-dependent Lon protease